MNFQRKNTAPLEQLEEEIIFAMVEKLNQLSKSFWDNLRISCILESLAVSKVGNRISENIGTLLGQIFMVKNLWILEMNSSQNNIEGTTFQIIKGIVFIYIKFTMKIFFQYYS